MKTERPVNFAVAANTIAFEHDRTLLSRSKRSFASDAGCRSLERSLEACAKAGVALVEQPLPAGQDAALAKIEHIVPICADESVHDRTGLEDLRARYDAINVKLDKTGGLPRRWPW